MYECSKEADKSVYGYSGRLKKLWDVHHPEHSNFTAKHLTTQAKRIQDKGLIMETKLNTMADTNTQNISTQEQREVPSLDNIPNIDQQQQYTQDNDITDRPQFDETAVTEMTETIKPTWTDNYEQYIKMDVHERKYLTKKDRKIEDIEFEAAKRIAEEKITETGADINLCHINVMQYTTAITLLGRHEKLRERKTRKYEKKEPGWMINITNRINAI